MNLLTRTLPVLALSTLALAGCAAQPTASHDAHDSTHAPSADHWDYHGDVGPSRWGDLSADNAACSAGTAQSPIDLPALGTGAPLDLELSDAVVDGTTADNGHTVQVTVGSGGPTVVDGAEYHLQQMHFHAGSEHTVEGEHAPVELHFVHADDDGNLLVIGAFGKVGAHNPAFDAYIEGADDEASAKTAKVDIAKMLPTERSYWSYDGSLTTPPCTEGVRWVVLATPIELGQDQIDELTDAHDHNFRPTQPLNDREVVSAGK